MSGIPVETRLPTAERAATRPRPLAVIAGRTSAVVVTHSVIDFFSFVIVAIMPALAAAHHLTGGQKAALLATGSVASGLIQPIVAWGSDRYNTRLLGVGGFVLGVVAVTSLGHAETFWHLVALQVLATIGIGAYHPVAAAMVGHAAGPRRSLGLSAFFVAGMIGGIGGNVGAPALLDTFGFDVMPVLLICGLVFAALLAWATLGASHRHDDAATNHASLSAAERTARWRAVWLLFAGNVLRFTVNMALVYLFVQWTTAVSGGGVAGSELSLEAGKRASLLNGQMQAAMQIGMGGAGLLAGWLLTVRHEKPALVLSPILGAAAIGLFPLLGQEDASIATLATAGALSITAGVGFGGLIPVTMSLAQRLLPHRTSLASGLMLGGAWTFAAAGPLLAEQVEGRWGLATAFLATSGALAAAGGLSLFLPSRVIRGV